MGKFNIPQKIEQKLEVRKDATVNLAGGLAFELTPQIELYTRVASWLVAEPKFYDPDGRDTLQAVNRLVEQLAATDPQFVLQVAAYARQDLYLRSSPVYLLARACKHPETRAFVEQYTPMIVRRADEICETLSAYSWLNPDQKTMSCRALRRGLDKALRNFDEYQLGKYSARGGVWSLRDAWRVIHPKPTSEEQSEMWKRVTNEQLTVPETWEIEMIRGGKEGRSKKEVWEQVLPRIGFMGIMRNLRNFLQEDVDLTLPIETLTNEEKVKRSRQFPYRFYAAFKAIFQAVDVKTNPNATRVLDALEDALMSSVANIPKMTGTTLIVADESQSMTRAVSNKSDISCLEIGNLMASLSFGFCETALVAGFGDYVVPITMRKRASVFDNMGTLQRSSPGYSTQGWRIPQFLIDNKIDVDRIIVFTDMQMYNDRHGSRESFASNMIKYRSQIGHPVWCYLFDLAGHGTTQMPQNDKYTRLIAGWSDKIFKFISHLEKNPNAVVEGIRERY